MVWKKGKTFKKGNRTVRYIYKNGRKSTKKLVTVKKVVVVIAEDINQLAQCGQCDTRTLNRFIIETADGHIVHCICNSCYAEWVE